MTSYSLVLYRGFPISASYVWSPFVTKLEARLRFGGLAYKIEQGAPPKGPRGKIPYLDISKGSGAAPETVSDTALISEQLVSEGLAADLNGKLSAVEKAYDLALRALLEDKLCLYQVCVLFISILTLFSSLSGSSLRASARYSTNADLKPHLYARATNVGNRTTMRCVLKFLPLSPGLCKSSSDKLLIAKWTLRSGESEPGDSLLRKFPSSRKRSGRM